MSLCTQFLRLVLNLGSFFSSLILVGRVLNISTDLQHQPFLDIPNLILLSCLIVPLSIGCCTLKLNSGGLSAPSSLSVLEGVTLLEGVMILVELVSTCLLFCLVVMISRWVFSSLTFSLLSVRKSAITPYFLPNVRKFICEYSLEYWAKNRDLEYS